MCSGTDEANEWRKRRELTALGCREREGCCGCQGEARALADARAEPWDDESMVSRPSERGLGAMLCAKGQR
ncbi:hypothetical protein HGA64_03530 [Candidatus Falkowbacteria bacterium]|nr:hypothetical protein [Candidatus Falkowbacteria bacterium]